MTSELYLGFKVTVIGMTIVFAALYVLQLVMQAMRLLFYRGVDKEISAQEGIYKSHIPEHKVPEPVRQGVSRSVLAAISAAIYACLGGKSANIVAIRREQSSAWQQAARAEATAKKSE